MTKFGRYFFIGYHLSHSNGGNISNCIIECTIYPSENDICTHIYNSYKKVKKVKNIWVLSISEMTKEERDRFLSERFDINNT